MGRWKCAICLFRYRQLRTETMRWRANRRYSRELSQRNVCLTELFAAEVIDRNRRYFAVKVGKPANRLPGAKGTVSGARQKRWGQKIDSKCFDTACFCTKRAPFRSEITGARQKRAGFSRSKRNGAARPRGEMNTGCRPEPGISPKNRYPFLPVRVFGCAI